MTTRGDPKGLSTIGVRESHTLPEHEVLAIGHIFINLAHTSGISIAELIQRTTEAVVQDRRRGGIVGQKRVREVNDG
jgi:hypothetical protein